MHEELEKFVASKRRDMESLLKETFFIVFLMGASGKGLEERRAIKRRLEDKGILAIIAEDDLPEDVSPSLGEEYVLKSNEVELAFINVESWGSVAEFVQYHRNPKVAPKLRVLVKRDFHPIYGKSSSYLTDLYLTHLCVYGHVYAYDGDIFPPPDLIIMKLAVRYKEWKALK